MNNLDQKYIYAMSVISFLAIKNDPIQHNNMVPVLNDYGFVS